MSSSATSDRYNRRVEYTGFTVHRFHVELRGGARPTNVDFIDLTSGDVHCAMRDGPISKPEVIDLTFEPDETIGVSTAPIIIDLTSEIEDEAAMPLARNSSSGSCEYPSATACNPAHLTQPKSCGSNDASEECVFCKAVIDPVSQTFCFKYCKCVSKLYCKRGVNSHRKVICGPCYHRALSQTQRSLLGACPVHNILGMQSLLQAFRNDCPICLEVPVSPLKIACGHEICAVCYAAEIVSCPLCRWRPNDRDR